MDFDFLDKYLWEVHAHANELLEHFDYEERELLAKSLTSHWQDFLPHLLDPPKTAFVFLGEDPTPQERRLAKLPEAERQLLWCQARYLALEAARALLIAKDVVYVKGDKYRQAVRRCAQAALQYSDQPTGWDIAMRQLPD